MIYSYKNIWQVSAPILIGMLIHQLIGMTDTIFLGHVGEIELGAAALGTILYIVLFMLGHGFSNGVQIIIARRNGEKNYHKIAEVFYQSSSFLLMIGVCIIVLTNLYSEAILRFFIASPKIAKATADYINPRVWGLLFAYIMVNFRAFFIGITQTKALTFNALTMLAINFVLDYLLIFGKFGFPALGIAGSAYASAIAEAASVIFFVIYLFYKNDFAKFGFEKIVWWNKKLLQEIFQLSIWTTLQSVIALATWLFFLLAIEKLGETELAVSNILRSISSLTFMLIASLSSTSNSLTSNLIGSGNETQIEDTAKRIIKLAYFIGIPMAFVFILGYQQIVMLYSPNAKLTENIFWPYLAMLSSYLTVVPGMIWLSAISGSGRTKLGLYIELACLAFYVSAIWYVVIYSKLSLTWCWNCEHYYNIPLAFICYYYMRQFFATKTKNPAGSRVTL